MLITENRAVWIVRDAITRMEYQEEYLAIVGMLTMAVRLGIITEGERDELRGELKTKYDTL